VLLTTLDLSSNELCGIDWRGQGTYNPSGIMAIAKALEVNAVLTNLDLSSNQLCGVWLNVNMYGGQQGTYDALGITAIAEALKVNRVLTRLNLQLNDLDNTAKDALRAAKSAPLELVL